MSFSVCALAEVDCISFRFIWAFKLEILLLSVLATLLMLDFFAFVG